MSPTTVSTLVKRIHATPTQLVLAVTGGGSGALAELLQVPGASRTVRAAVVPYAEAALEQFVGGKLERLCSADTARTMATACLRQACFLTGGDDRLSCDPAAPLAGVACTAALATDRPRKGEHRVHLATQTATTTRSSSLVLAKGRRTRAEEEQLVTRLVINHVAAVCGLEDELPLDLLDGEELRTAHDDTAFK